ncbi:hypothetical protein CBS101457_004652 [Exobasidium rhododendri]|nr:hypothetical protein CBS101457_004652 [Exobasidium rhododendri]
MSSPRKYTSHYGDSSLGPPSYRQNDEYDREVYEGDEEVEERHRSGAPMSLTPGGTYSSRARIIGGEHGGYYNNTGAGRRPYLDPDTPSMYSDPYECNSAVTGGSKKSGSPNIPSNSHDIGHAPYDHYDSTGHNNRSTLTRNNSVGTLGPEDSISLYNVDGVSRNLEQGDERNGRAVERPLSQQERQEQQPTMYDQGAYNNYGDNLEDYDKTLEYYPVPHQGYGGYGSYGQSSDEAPLKNYSAAMGYADNEDQEMKQRETYWNGYPQDNFFDQKHPPSLFANNLQGAPVLPRQGTDESVEDRKGLLGALPWGRKEGAKTGWGGTLEEQIHRRRKGVGRQKWPILTWVLSVAYVAVFIVELIKSKQETGQAIQTSPSWNPMLGPPFEFLISFGARFVPCMRVVPDIPTTTQLACLKYSTLSTLTSDQQCPIWELCGLPNASTTNQAYRFIAPIFLHAGFIHIGFNLLVQLTLCAQIEKLISTPFYAIIYFAGGIGGNLLGGNFGLVGQPSVGASGAIYTCISLELIDLCYNWKYEYRPKTRLWVSVIFAVIGFAIGLLPGLDNFAHIGGFAVGMLGGLIFCPSIHETKRHRIITWIIRVVAAGLLVGFFVGLGTNFYFSEDPNKACTWCRYLSCLPVFSQCKGNGLTNTTSNGTSTNNF